MMMYRKKKFAGMSDTGKTSVAKQVSAEFARALLFFDSLTRFEKLDKRSRESNMEFDIALLELKRPVPFEEYPHIRPICLPENSDLDVSSLRGFYYISREGMDSLPTDTTTQTTGPSSTSL